MTFSHLKTVRAFVLKLLNIRADRQSLTYSRILFQSHLQLPFTLSTHVLDQLLYTLNRNRCRPSFSHSYSLILSSELYHSFFSLSLSSPLKPWSSWLTFKLLSVLCLCGICFNHYSMLLVCFSHVSLPSSAKRESNAMPLILFCIFNAQQQRFKEQRLLNV